MRVFEKINHGLKAHAAAIKEILADNHVHTAAVYDWMCDSQSKANYEKELAFQALVRLIPLDSAIGSMSLVSTDSFRAHVLRARELDEHGKMPQISMMSTTTEFMRYYLYATTFLIEQYKYAPHVTIEEGDVVFDCGGCFGETSVWACQEGAAASYCFEPSPEHEKHILRNISRHSLEGKMHHVPFALGKEKGTAHFHQVKDNPGASTVGAPSKTSIAVDVTNLDAWCAEHDVKPDFIKMDIEGAELDTIRGAERIFREYKPRFAICLYHRLTDMWTIPHLLKSLCPEYSFWCKKNAHVDEFVLYGKVVSA